MLGTIHFIITHSFLHKIIYTSKIIFSEWIKKMKEQHQISKVRRCTTTTHKGFYLELHSPVKSTGGERDSRPNQENFFRPFRSKDEPRGVKLWRGVICGEMVGIERQLDTITFISPRVVAQPGRPPDGCNGPHKNKSCYMLPWWPASPIAFQRLSSPDASILKILYDVQWRELKGTTTYISIVINFFIQ